MIMSCLSWLFSPPFVIIITITKMVALENLDCNDLNLNSLKKLKWKNKNQDMLKCWNGIHNGGKFLCRNNWHVPFLNPFMWLNFNSKILTYNHFWNNWSFIWMHGDLIHKMIIVNWGPYLQKPHHGHHDPNCQH